MLHQAQGAPEVLVRVGGGDRFILHMATLDSTQGTKDSCRFYGVSNAATVHSKIRGGIYRIGVPPADDDCEGYPSNLIDHWVTNVTFLYDQPNGPGYPAAFNLGYHVHKVVLDNVRVSNPNGGRFVDVEGISLCAPTDPHPIVEIRNCTLNGAAVTINDCHGDLTNVTIIND